MKYIDTHCHYENKKFDNNRTEILKKIESCCDKIICVGTNIPENKRIIDLSKKYDFIYNMIGFFPTYVNLLDSKYCENAKENLDMLINQLNTEKNVGLGEIGLDYSWNSVGTLKGNEARELQKKWFKEQINIANLLNKPISIHSRDAEEDTIKILNDFDNIKGAVHCFSYTKETAKKCLNKGLYLSFGGTSTYKANQNIRDSIIECPIDRILLETDAPYLSPEPVIRTLNTSENIKYVIELISTLKKISEEDLIIQTNKNCYDLYNFK